MATPTGPSKPGVISDALKRLAARPTPIKGQVGGAPVAPPKVHDTTELTYDEAVARYGGLQGPTLKLPTREEFGALAATQAVQEHRLGRAQQNERLSAGLGAAEPVTGPGGALAATQDTRTVEEKISQFQSDLTALGQWDPKLGKGQEQLAVDYRNLTEVAIGLMSLTGDTEEEQQSRRVAAQLFHDHMKELAPHIKELDPEGQWWGANYKRINSTLDDMEPGFKERFLTNLMNWTPSGYILSALGQTGQGAANALAGIRSAIDTGDEISAGEGLKYAGSSFARGIGGLAEYASLGAVGLGKGIGEAALAASRGEGGQALGDLRTGLRIGTGGVDEQLSIGLDPANRLIQGGDTLYSMDQDQSGDLNLREALGKDPHEGGRALGLIDTVGLAAIDPLTWATMGQGTAVKAGLRTLEASSDDVARMAGRRLANGASWKVLTEAEQAAATSAWLKAQSESLANMTRAQLMRQGYKNPEAFIAKVQGQAKDMDKWVGTLRDIRVRRLEESVANGSVPGLRIGGKTVVPMRRLYDALGVIDSRVAQEGSWANTLLKTQGLTNTDELLHFVQNFDGVTIPDHLKDEIRGWNVMANKLASDDPGTWLDPLLQKAEDPAAVMDQVDAFGRQLFDDRIVSSWRQWFDEEFRPDVITPVEREGLMAAHSEDVARAVKAGEEPPTLPYAYDEELSDSAKAMLRRGQAPRDTTFDVNIDELENKPYDVPRAPEPEVPDVIDLNTVDLTGPDVDLRTHPYDYIELRDIPKFDSPEYHLGETIADMEDALFVMPEMSKWADDTLKATDQIGSLRRRIATLTEEDLPRSSQFKLDRNWDVFNNPTEWVLKDLKPKGLRSLSGRDDIIGAWVRRITDDFSPRAKVRRAVHLGRGAADMLDEETVIAAAKRSMFEDHAARLGLDIKGNSRLARDAQKELRTAGSDMDVWEQATRFLTENEDNIQAIVDQTRESGMPALAEMVEVLDAIRRDIFDMSVVAGADEGVLLARKGYMPRVLTQEIRDAAEKALREHQSTLIDKFKEMGVIDDADQVVGGGHPLTQGGHLEGRAMYKDIEDLFEVNRRAREDLIGAGLVDPNGTLRLYEDNPMRAVLIRSRQANEAYIYASLIDGLSEVKDLRGRALSYVARSEDEVANMKLRMAADTRDYGGGDYVARNLPGGGKMYIDRTIATEIESMRRIMGAPNIEGTFRKTMEAWNGIWGAYATVPLVGFGFHMRNATGNMYNMILAGVKDPAVLKDGFVAQRAMSKVNRLMRGEDPERLIVKGARSHSMTFEEALAEVVQDEGLRNQLRGMRTHGILGGGQTPDLFDTAFDPLRRGKARGPFDTRNKVVDSGRRMGTMIENHARASLYVDGLQRGLTPRGSAARVRSFLFDYSDLTEFEADNVRMMSRFYTFLRKNTALQMRMLVTQPGTIVNANRLMQEVTDGIFGGLAGLGEATGVTPGEDLGAGRQVPPWASTTLRLYGRGTLGGMDTPFASFLESQDTIANLLKVPPAFVMSATGSDESRQEGANLLRHNLRSGLTLLSGGPVEGVRTLSEFATGVDTFTGAKLDDKDRNGLDTWTRLIDVVFPVAGKIDRELEYTGAYDKLGVFEPDTEEGEYSRSQGGLRMLNLMLGLTVLPDIDDPQVRRRNLMGLQASLYTELDNARDKASTAGVDVPSYDELIRAGKATARNDAMDFLLYNTLAGEPLTKEQKAKLEALVPREVLEASGYDVPEKEKKERTAADSAARVREMASAMEALGIHLTEDDIQALILRESGARLADVKDLGINPSFINNPYLATDKPEDYEAQRRAEGQEKLAALAELFGVSIEELQASRPLLQPAQLKAEQMREAGYSEQQIVDELVSSMSREKRAMLFGEDSLEATRAYKPLTAEEILDTQAKAASAEAELRVMLQLTTGRQPTQEELNEWLSEVMFTAPEQRAMGYQNYSAPARDDKTPDDVYAERLRQKLAATQATTGFGGPRN